MQQFLIFAVAVVSLVDLCAYSLEIASSAPYEPLRNRAITKESGVCESVSWTFNSSTGALVVSGSGEVPSSCDFGAHSDIISIVIEEGITSIADNAFEACSRMVSLRIPDSVTIIGNYSFSGCGELKSLSLGKGVKTIGTSAFQFCSKLESIVIPDSVVTIGLGAFHQCNSLTSLTIGNNVKSIKDFAFCGCSVLEALIIPDSVETIDSYAFSTCSCLKSLKIGNNVKFIGATSFYGHNLTSLVIPDSVQEIDNWAFGESSRLESLYIGRNVTSLKDDAFDAGIELGSVFIPGWIKEIGGNSFIKCKRLSSTASLSDNSTFYRCKSLSRTNNSQFSCIPFDNDFAAITDISTYSNSTNPDDIRGQENHCHEGFICSDNTLFVQKSSNATSWEGETNECVEYKCYNDSGKAIENVCNGDGMICVNEKCVKNDMVGDKQWVVELVIDNFEEFHIDMMNILSNVSAVTGVEANKLKIGAKVNDEGKDLHIFIYVNDESSAKTIVKSVTEISAGSTCQYGLLCRTRTVQMQPNALYLSESPLTFPCFTIVLVFSFFFNLF